MEIAKDVSRLIDIDTIYVEPEVKTFPRGKVILEKFPGARLIEVPSHWKIPSLHGNEGFIQDWIKLKRQTLGGKRASGSALCLRQFRRSSM